MRRRFIKLEELYHQIEPFFPIRRQIGPIISPSAGSRCRIPEYNNHQFSAFFEVFPECEVHYFYSNYIALQFPEKDGHQFLSR